MGFKALAAEAAASLCSTTGAHGGVLLASRRHLCTAMSTNANGEADSLTGGD
eukprot:NODE_25133_length_598_cov_1.830149.p3 GENE.NODE_25133_length_598_cov_1.830149~~NODE_25133_length_598_cov_1.830149.p3  ORF type:complete len:52 (-),score=10.26 NODE_25133_length_598_cov_1.830149:166-321(-)